jgi:hypothetical protein
MGPRPGLGALGSRKKSLARNGTRKISIVQAVVVLTAKVISATATTLFQLLLPPSSVKVIN